MNLILFYVMLLITLSTSINIIFAGFLDLLKILPYFGSLKSDSNPIYLKQGSLLSPWRRTRLLFLFPTVVAFES